MKYIIIILITTLLSCEETKEYSTIVDIISNQRIDTILVTHTSTPNTLRNSLIGGAIGGLLTGRKHRILGIVAGGAAGAALTNNSSDSYTNKEIQVTYDYTLTLSDKRIISFYNRSMIIHNKGDKYYYN